VNFYQSKTKRIVYGALCVTLLATSAVAQQAEDKDVPSSSTEKFDEATLKLLQAQETLSRAASEIRWEVEKNWNAQAGGSGNYNSIKLNSDAVVLRWKGELPDNIAQAVERARRIAPVRVEAVANSRIDLKAAASSVGDFIEAQSKVGGAYHGVWVIDDERIRVDVLPKQDIAAAREALPKVSVPVEVRQIERVQLMSRYNDSPPWWGGARYFAERYGQVRSQCTTGFGVTNGSTKYILSAAHCGTYPDRAVDPTWEFMGYVGAELWSHDIVLINTASAGSRIYDGGVNVGEFSKGVAGWDWVYSNDFLCHSGSTSGVMCGFRPIAWAERVWGCDSDGDCFWIEDLIAAELLDGRQVGQGGDSGGPVFFPRSDGRVTAKGTITARSWDNLLLFQDFGTAWRDFGVWPITQ
jgi:hypothetical protein